MSAIPAKYQSEIAKGGTLSPAARFFQLRAQAAQSGQSQGQAFATAKTQLAQQTLSNPQSLNIPTAKVPQAQVVSAIMLNPQAKNLFTQTQLSARSLGYDPSSALAAGLGSVAKAYNINYDYSSKVLAEQVKLEAGNQQAIQQVDIGGGNTAFIDRATNTFVAASPQNYPLIAAKFPQGLSTNDIFAGVQTGLNQIAQGQTPNVSGFTFVNNLGGSAPNASAPGTPLGPTQGGASGSLPPTGSNAVQSIVDAINNGLSSLAGMFGGGSGGSAGGGQAGQTSVNPVSPLGGIDFSNPIVLIAIVIAIIGLAFALRG